MISIEIVAAMALNRVIGLNGRLPWHEKRDLERFRELTMNRVVIMGRKTAESLPGPLGGRYLIAISQAHARIPFVQHVAPSFAEAILAGIAEYAKRVNRFATSHPIFIAGGREIYETALDSGVVERIHLTLIDHEYDGDTLMPFFEQNFTLDREGVSKIVWGETSGDRLAFVEYQRVKALQPFQMRDRVPVDDGLMEFLRNAG